MKKAIIFGIIITSILLPNFCYAEKNDIDTSEIIESQSKSLYITGFLEETEKYKTDVLEDVDISTVLSDAIKGDIDESTIGKKIFSIFFKEALEAIATMSSIIVIIIIHSFLKSISDGLENKSVSQIVFYVTYILIITMIMKNFSEILSTVKGAIEDLVGFINSLLPILMALMVSTGSIASASMLQPIILFMITFIGNMITAVIIPFTLISVALGIVSNISDKVQISKLSKYINKTTVWILGIVLTLFVGIASLEGSITSGVDRFNSKNYKSRSIKFYTSCWKNIAVMQ